MTSCSVCSPACAGPRCAPVLLRWSQPTAKEPAVVDLTLTPHCAGYTDEALDIVLDRLHDDLRERSGHGLAVLASSCARPRPMVLAALQRARDAGLVDELPSRGQGGPLYRWRLCSKPAEESPPPPPTPRKPYRNAKVAARHAELAERLLALGVVSQIEARACLGISENTMRDLSDTLAQQGRLTKRRGCGRGHPTMLYPAEAACRTA